MQDISVQFILGFLWHLTPPCLLAYLGYLEESCPCSAQASGYAAAWFSNPWSVSCRCSLAGLPKSIYAASVSSLGSEDNNAFNGRLNVVALPVFYFGILQKVCEKESLPVASCFFNKSESTLEIGLM